MDIGVARLFGREPLKTKGTSGLTSRKCTPAQRELVDEALSAFSDHELERLRAARLSIEFTGPGKADTKWSGLYNAPVLGFWGRPKIKIQNEFQPAHQVGTIRHEVIHALDNLDQGAGLHQPTFASQTDRELRSLYRDYQANYAVEKAQNVLDDLSKQGRSLQASYEGQLQTPDRLVNFTYLGPTPQTNGQPVVVFEEEPDFKVPSAPGWALAATGAAIMAIATPVALAAGAAFLLLGGLGIQAARSLAIRQECDKPNREFTQSVRLPDGRDCRVVRGQKQTHVLLPSDSGQNRCTTDRIWNDYSVTSDSVPEYLAEGGRYFLGTAEQRQILQSKDPGLFAYLERKGLGASPP